MRFVDEFIDKEGNPDQLRDVLSKFNNNPHLARCLVGIYEFNKSDVTSALYNPQYDEMIKAGITVEDVKIFKKYIDFSDKMSKKEKEKYKHCDGSLNQGHRFYIDGSDLKNFNLK